jgi:hypothetical protein
MELGGYRWGENLWHSTAVLQMSTTELEKIFGHRVTLLFDELMQRGGQMNELRKVLTNTDAKIVSFVCVRRRAKVESGELRELEAVPCEDLDEKEFSQRVAFVSRLASSVFEPPADVDHVVLKTKLKGGINPETFLDHIANYGLAFVVWNPDAEQKYLAITLDRPQFFDTSDVDFSGLSADWRAPCKVRFYMLPEEGVCYCSFITYPEIQGSIKDWRNVISRSANANQQTLLDSSVDDSDVKRVYWRLCMKSTLKLFNDFVVSGVAAELVDFKEASDALDRDQLCATFGPSLGGEIFRDTKEILERCKYRQALNPRNVPMPVSLRIRDGAADEQKSFDAFACRTDLLKNVPQKEATVNSVNQGKSFISYSELYYALDYYAESTIGAVLDNELDKETTSPLVQVDRRIQDGIEIIEVRRGFVRGEFGVWFEWRSDIQGHHDEAIQRTLGVSVKVLDGFLSETKMPQLTATHFNKLFANLQHDWREPYGLLYLGWKPYKYGPVPVAPAPSPSGQYRPFHHFLVDMRCLTENKEQHESQIWSRFTANKTPDIPWEKVYERKVEGITKEHVNGLLRLYAAIHLHCSTQRLEDPQSSELHAFRDPLVVLATARNSRTTYICGWFEVADWTKKAEFLFPLLEAASLTGVSPREAYLEPRLSDFAAPPTLLYHKIQMYRNIEYLRKQIETLQKAGNLDAAEVLLETTDSKPVFESNAKYPVANLEYACHIMRAYSSMTRQILTLCGLDVEKQINDQMKENGTKKDAQHYLNELTNACHELKPMEADLQNCIKSSQQGVLTQGTADCLKKVFNMIMTVLKDKIPDPRPPYEIDRERMERRDGLIRRLQSVPISGPYAVAVADIRNFLNIADLATLFEKSYDEGIEDLLDFVHDKATIVCRSEPTDVHLCGFPADNVVLAGPSADRVVSAVLALIRETTKYVADKDRRLTPFGLLRVGVAWHENELGNDFLGVKPGLIAFDLADKTHQPPGAISVTKAIVDRLPPSLQKQFLSLSDGKADQGGTFVRYWNEQRDLGVERI